VQHSGCNRCLKGRTCGAFTRAQVAGLLIQAYCLSGNLPQVIDLRLWKCCLSGKGGNFFIRKRQFEMHPYPSFIRHLFEFFHFFSCFLRKII
jgi:hypothetical protein